MEPLKSKKGRPPKGTPLAASGKSVKLLPDVDIQLSKAAKKLKMTKSDFASAAVAYFTENGLDPRTTSRFSLAKIESSILNETFDVREHTATIGNRLVGVIRTFERNMGTLFQQQQGGTFRYLESIERNILSYLVNLEENLFNTILERMVRGNVQNHINRVLLQSLSLKLDDKRFPFSEKELAELTSGYDEQENRRVVVEGRQLLETKKVTRPKATVVPAVVEIPKAPAPNKPATETPAAAPGASGAATSK